MSKKLKQDLIIAETKMNQILNKTKQDICIQTEDNFNTENVQKNLTRRNP